MTRDAQSCLKHHQQSFPSNDFKFVSEIIVAHLAIAGADLAEFGFLLGRVTALQFTFPVSFDGV